MKKLLFFLLAIQSSLAANYIPLSSGIQLYDIEVVVFARHLPQPDSSLFNNRDLVELDEVNAMFSAVDMPWLIDNEKKNGEEEWQVPLEGDIEHNNNTQAKALAWFAFDDAPSQNPVFSKLNNHPQMHALFYQKWRQPATPYRNPGFVKVSNWPDDLINPDDIEESNDLGGTIVGNLFEEDDNSEIVDDLTGHMTSNGAEALYSDYTLRGKVAFSKQRFHHGHIKLNLFRDSSDGASLVYLIDQNSQIDLNKWQYYDHTQFGVMLKVSLATDFNNPMISTTMSNEHDAP